MPSGWETTGDLHIMYRGQVTADVCEVYIQCIEYGEQQLCVRAILIMHKSMGAVHDLDVGRLIDQLIE